MNIQFLLAGAETMAEKGEKEASCNLPQAAQSFRMAAKKYRQLADVCPNERNKYIALAEQYEQKASGAAGFVAPPQNVGGAPAGTGGAPYGGNGGANANGSQAGRGVPVNNSATVANQQPTSATTVTEDITVEEALSRLNGQVGLSSVKQQVGSWVSQVEAFKMRKDAGLPVPEGFSYHLVFTGNPGTGKTTVARFMAQIYKGLGILQQGQLVEAAREDLVAGYVGQTAKKTKEVIETALGGVLFIDEAYTLNSESKTDFGIEAINTLLKAMEDHRDELVVIMAGYSKPMDDLIKTNSGLKSRFNTVIEFEDYTGEELFKIFSGLCKKNQYDLSPTAQNMLKKYFDKLYAERDEDFGNGRTARNVFQSIVLAQSQRVAQMSKVGRVTIEDLKTITDGDVSSVICNKNASQGELEYEKVKAEVTQEYLFGLLSQNNLGTATVALCTRLESVLKHVYKLSGDLSEMINQLRSAPVAAKIGKDGFDLIYRIRTYRNSFVHSTTPNVTVSAGDVMNCFNLISAIDA